MYVYMFYKLAYVMLQLLKYKYLGHYLTLCCHYSILLFCFLPCVVALETFEQPTEII